MKDVISGSKSDETAVSLSLLYVDDSLPLLEIMKYILEKELGIFVQICQNPEHALQLLLDHVYDLIISDYDMPGINGIEFLNHIRLKGITTPFILYTCYFLEEIRGPGIKDNSFFYLYKLWPTRDQIGKIQEIVHQLDLSDADEHVRFPCMSLNCNQ